MSEIKLGGEIDCICPKCKKENKVDTELGHTILSIDPDTGSVDKVRCNTCGYEHKYSVKKKASASSTATKKRSVKEKDGSNTESATSVVTSSAQWEKIVGNRDLSAAKAYKFAEKYNEGDIIKHDVFGTGIVTNVKCDNKITVMFQDRLRLLVHNRSAI